MSIQRCRSDVEGLGIEKVKQLDSPGNFAREIDRADWTYATKELVAKSSGFSLHAGVASKAHERDKLERICRYITRPAVSEERLSTDDAGNVIYRFKKAWDDGTTALKLTPMELMERLVALVPRPRVHLTRYHGVLGPHYKHRKQIVPKPPELKLVQETQPGGAQQLELKKKNLNWPGYWQGSSTLMWKPVQSVVAK